LPVAGESHTIGDTPAAPSGKRGLFSASVHR
jgi:hypothetical protein